MFFAAVLLLLLQITYCENVSDMTVINSLTLSAFAETVNDFAAYGPIGNVMVEKYNKTTDTLKFIMGIFKEM